MNGHLYDTDAYFFLITMLVDSPLIIVALVLLGLLFMLGVFVYRDARRTGTSYPLLWGFLSFIGGLGGVAVYYFYRHDSERNQIINERK